MTQGREGWHAVVDFGIKKGIFQQFFLLLIDELTAVKGDILCLNVSQKA